MLISFSLFSNINAQNENCNCCTPEYDQFDFWLGSWMVFDTLGNAVGSNYIEKVEGNCALQEHWHSSGSTGTSLNFFDKKDGKWHQTWIDSKGITLYLSGIKVGESMVLRSDLITGRNGDFYHRITWTPQGEDVVQRWEIVDVNNKPMRVLFEGIYKRDTEQSRLLLN